MPARTRARRVGYGRAIAKYGGVITTDRVYRSRVREDQARRTRRRALDADTSLFSMRTGEGMKVAKAKGRLRGRQAKLTVRQEAHLAALHAGGDYTPGELAELFRSAPPPSTVLCPEFRPAMSWFSPSPSSSPRSAGPDTATGRPAVATPAGGAPSPEQSSREEPYRHRHGAWAPTPGPGLGAVPALRMRPTEDRWRLAASGVPRGSFKGCLGRLRATFHGLAVLEAEDLDPGGRDLSASSRSTHAPPMCVPRSVPRTAIRSPTANTSSIVVTRSGKAVR